MTGIVGLATLNRRTILTEMVGVLACLSATLAMSSEVEFELGFHNPLDKTELSWTAQQGATGYQLLRSALTDFSADCEDPRARFLAWHRQAVWCIPAVASICVTSSARHGGPRTASSTSTSAGVISC